MSRRVVPSPNANDALIAESTRFGADLLRIGGEAATGRVLLAVSGGPDSMAMLTLAIATLPGRIVAATVDHQLRAEAAGEAAIVSSWCSIAGVPHAVLAPDRPIMGASVQAAARAARYALLAREAARTGAACILTAHHADDQAETFLMRAARGSGLAGLAGVRARTVVAGAVVVRPLLEWRRAELRAIVRREEVPFVDDASNADPVYDRTRLRQLIEANEWLDPPGLAQSATALGEIDADLRALTDWLWGQRSGQDAAAVRLDPRDLPRELRRRLVRRAITSLRESTSIDTPAWSESVNIEPLLDRLEAGRRATQAGIVVSSRGGLWHFRPAPPRKHG